jgi:hypothetical protein
LNPQGKLLGILTPVGGGDPIPLTKSEVMVGRRRSCDVCLDFNNISGKHCQLRWINGVWHVRDLGSTNGTSLNGMALTSEHTVLPDDELTIASHVFTIDYEPSGPEALLQMHGEEVEEGQGRRQSILDLAGIETDERPRHRRGSAASSIVSSPEFALGSGTGPAPGPGAGPAPGPGAGAAPAPPAAAAAAKPNPAPQRPAAPRPKPEFGEEIPDDFKARPAKPIDDDDDFLKLIEEDVKKAGDKRENRK